MRIFLTIAISGLLLACSPKIYVVDRETVLQSQAAGDWPDYEKNLLKDSLKTGPTPFPKLPESAEQARLLKILNGNLTDSESAKQ